MIRHSLNAFKRPRGSLVSRVPRRLHSVIGIDLGTTNSAVAIVESNEARILENEEGQRTTPSIVAFSKDAAGDKTLVGLPAKRQAAVNPQNTFFATKRLIGRKYEDDEIQKDLDNIPYKIVPHTNGDAWLSTSYGKSVSPSEIGGLILEKMKQVAEAHLSQDKLPIKHAVVTVPAYFNDSQRQATKNSGKLVGLEVLRVVNEPTAAALAYGIDKKQKDGVVAVFDLGGGTFDISILDIDEGVFEVRATNGNTHLGGEDFDILLLNYILDTFKAENNGLDILKDRVAVQRIREAAEKCKIELSHVKETEINIPFITSDKHIKIKITEDELDEMTLHLINKTIDPVKRCIRDADLKIKDIDEVLLVGGMTRMPKIRKVVEELFNKKPSTAVNPDEAVALGAAIQGAVLSGQIKNVVLLDVTPLSLGIETYGGIFSPLIPRNSAVPVKKEQVFSTAVDGQTGVEIRVFQGERSLVKDNKLIGNFKLSNIPIGPKGSPQIAVNFEIDADGIINVSATDKTPYPEDLENFGKKNTVSIQVSGETGLSEEEIKRILDESTANKEKDAEARKYYEHASRAEIICTDTDNAIIQFGDLMEQQEKDSIGNHLARIREKIEDIRSGRILHSPDILNNELNEMQQECLQYIQKVAMKQRDQAK
ncbi:nuclear-encoded mitochondrial protein member of the heat shock protein 70 family [Suhomyces tanzawaensis NRRL Y-17324]|uniref:Nuclear-encoded mitochondrial protein member of the heat shock protein 70 family n=1 Tax=Suhomyces tanzawaensis NRRL Y-17324 TaxID=984487 RepID=A0A1E4SH91_9ASCO|nr:nuclear-encoded mitochondrial protein member of the heat shock protein 70 family [Suhomyces tanzawaensis NRRL Y-17324]ODV78845.1 nuclear-encoded mitochondrial protein member of the heat shock protein 70 family [Suhomyces tanzawaensis NRRL Y-17324]